MTGRQADPAEANLESFRLEDLPCDRLLIGGAWSVAEGHRIDVVAAHTEEVVASVPSATPAEAERAVASAASAFDAWSATAPEERAQALLRLADALERRVQLVAAVAATEVGTPLRMSEAIQARLPVAVLRSYAAHIAEIPWRAEVGNSRVLREAVGVVAAITPWNYPLHQAVCKVGGALAAGCSVVLKVSSVAPLTGFVLAEAAMEACLPEGVLNVLSGAGSVVGSAMISDPRVAAVSFTGSTEAGRTVAAQAAERLQRVSLELGGKSANLILEGADLDRAVKAGVNNAFLNSGQTCTALTRMLVPRSRQSEVIDRAVAAANALPVGDPFDPATRLGPLASGEQRQVVESYVEGALAEGTPLACGGKRPDGLDRGFFVEPTIFYDVPPDSRIAREEIFGPVLSVIPYDDEEEAVRIANDTIYGLAGAVWASDTERAEYVARRLRTGMIDVNGGRFNPSAPFGGYGQSGYGRELGVAGIEEFTELKAIQR